ncbi:MAG: hypothetical protein ACLQVJ_10180 [Syntrophobacteraceae bacterium]
MILAVILILGWILWIVDRDNLESYIDKNGIKHHISEREATYAKYGGRNEHMIESHTGIHRRRE